jgi:alkylated DNA nucleotide flippase Atl1
MRLTSLPAPEQDVLVQLAQSRETNVVFLAAALWRTTPDWKAYDPYPLITYTLDSLSARGLVTFRLTKGVNEGGWTSMDMPTDIRLTPEGWTLMGYPNLTVEIGTRQRHNAPVAHTGDMTIYRNHPFRATAIGPIETMTFAEHRSVYPKHEHMYGVPLTMANQSTQAKRTARLAEPEVLEDPNGTGNTRGYIRVTPEIEAAVLATRERLGAAAYADIAEVAGLPERTVRYVLTDLPRLRRGAEGEERAAKSLKERIYAIVEAIGEVKDVTELRRILGMADSEHDVMHVLHSLHTQGRIDFTERGSGMGKATVVAIRLPKKGSKRLTPEVVEALPEIVRDRLPEQVQPFAGDHAVMVTDVGGGQVEVFDPVATGPEATTEEPHVLPPSAPESEAEAYPLLDALLDRERTRQDADAKGMAFVVAAEAIQDIDPDTAAVLMAKANQYNVPFPSPIEQEYIRYVAAHPALPDAEA